MDIVATCRPSKPDTDIHTSKGWLTFYKQTPGFTNVYADESCINVIQIQIQKLYLIGTCVVR